MSKKTGYRNQFDTDITLKLSIYTQKKRNQGHNIKDSHIVERLMEQVLKENSTDNLYLHKSKKRDGKSYFINENTLGAFKLFCVENQLNQNSVVEGAIYRFLEKEEGDS